MSTQAQPDGERSPDLSPPSLRAGSDPVLRGQRVALRPVVLADYENLRLIELSERLIASYRHRGQTPSPESFASRLWAGVIAQFVIMKLPTGEPLGSLACFEPDYRNGHAQIGGTLFPSIIGKAWPLEGFRLFFDYIFHSFPFRKLYGYSLAPVAAQFGSAFAELAVEEGRLRDHEYLNGEFVDLVIFSIGREQWLEARSQYVHSGLLQLLLADREGGEEDVR